MLPIPDVGRMGSRQQVWGWHQGFWFSLTCLFRVTAELCLGRSTSAVLRTKFSGLSSGFTLPSSLFLLTRIVPGRDKSQQIHVSCMYLQRLSHFMHKLCALFKSSASCKLPSSHCATSSRTRLHWIFFTWSEQLPLLL